MSEEVLKALMQLFGIIAKLNGVTNKERHVVKSFLDQQLNLEGVNKYLSLFQEATLTTPSKKSQNIEKGERLTSVQDSSKMLRICTQINGELTQPQKIIVIFRIIELIYTNEVVSEQEYDFVSTVASIFNISLEEFKDIEEFIKLKTPYDLHTPNILVISSELHSRKSKHIHLAHVHGFVAILRIASLEMYLVKYCGNADYYLNGIILKPYQIYPFATGSTVRGNRIEPIYYSDVVSQFLTDRQKTNFTFETKNLYFKFPNGKFQLNNVNLAESAGRLIGIMGASGSGKSTLLEILNGNLKPQKGQVLINQIDVHQEKSKIEGIIGYVPQNDLLIERLTIYQNLYYAAKLSFGHYTEEEINKLVTQTLKNLGLHEIKDFIVGSPLSKTTISGGERKRLNIGLELLRAPSVLFIDEPTSGLSSRDSENVMDLLKELALRGKLIFVVIHQPSSNIYKMFDKLYILDVGGYPIYYGNPVDAIIYFKKMANQINSEQAECKECGNVNPEQIFDIIEAKVVNEYGRFTNQRKISPRQWYEIFQENIAPVALDIKTDPIPRLLDIPNKFKQFVLFAKRDILSKFNNKLYLVMSLLQAPLLALLLSYILRYYPTKEGVGKYIFSENENIPVYIFISIIISMFIGLIVSAEEISSDKKILKREAFLNLSRNSYLVSKIGILFTFSAIQTFSLIIIGNTLLGIKGMNITYWLVLFSTACFANMLGLIISSSFDSAVTIYVLIPILIIPQLVLGGIVVRFDKMNPRMTTAGKPPVISSIITSRWAFEALVVNQYRDNYFERNVYPFDKAMAIAEFKKVYYFPLLETYLQYCVDNFKDENKEIKNKVEERLEVLQNELTSELERIPIQQKVALAALNPQAFNEKVGEDAKKALQEIRKYYVISYLKTQKIREALIAQVLTNQEQKEKFFEVRQTFHNDAIANLVKNIDAEERIAVADGRLIAKIYPIFSDPTIFSMPYFAAQKKFLGDVWDTYWVNILVLWFMTLILYICLYFNILRKLMDKITHLV